MHVTTQAVITLTIIVAVFVCLYFRNIAYTSDLIVVATTLIIALFGFAKSLHLTYKGVHQTSNFQVEPTVNRDTDNTIIAETILPDPQPEPWWTKDE
jgi:uncharacterized protein YacL